jgi:hypothetical protein
MQVTPVAVAHGSGRIVGGGEGLADDAGEEIEVGRSGGGWDGFAVSHLSRPPIGGRRSSTPRTWTCPRGPRAWGTRFRGNKLGLANKFVEADGDSLREVHGGLAGMGGDFDEVMAERKILAREAALFRTEDESDAAAASESGENDGSESGKRYDGLLGLAASEGCGAEDERAIGDGL